MRQYECNLPGPYPTQMYIFALDSSDSFHLKITQGDYTYFYNFPAGYYTATSLTSYFNNQLQLTNESPLLLQYTESTDTFSFTVDDSYGQLKEPDRPDFILSYTMEFSIDGSSTLLQRLGFITTATARLGTTVQNLLSSDRVLNSQFPTYFLKTTGASQGYYYGGTKNDSLSSLWSPAEFV